MTIDYRKVVTLTTYQSPYVEIIYNTNGYQVTDTVTRYTKPVFLIGGSLFGDAALDLNFASTLSLTDSVSGNNLVTFTRASSGTYVDANGVIQTAASDEPRFDHDPVTGESLGLLIEEERTNFITQSASPNPIIANDVTVSSETIATPTGESASVKKHTLTSINPAAITNRWGSQTAGDSTSPYAGSVWVKTDVGTIDINIDVNDGPPEAFTITTDWQRVSSSSPAKGGELSWRWIDFTVQSGTVGSAFYVWGMQIEEGSFPTSYIPTSDSAVTRAADLASITGTNFSSWYNQGEGSFTVTADRLGSSGSQSTVLTTDGFRLPEFTFNGSGNASIYSPDIGTYTTPGSVLEATFGWSFDGTGASRAINGAVSSVAISSVVDTNTALYLGNYLNNATLYRLSGHISRLTYFPTRKTDQELIKITDGTLDPAIITYGITSAGGTFNLRSSGTVDYAVDWDSTGGYEASTSNTLAHTYTAGNYDLVVYSDDVYRAYFANVTADATQITSVAIGSGADLGTSLGDAWNGASNMASFACSFSAASAVTSFTYAWYNCTSLTSFPLLDTSSGANFYAAWYDCNSLTSFPLLNTSSGTNFAYAWHTCSSLADFPANMFDTTGTLVSSAFTNAWLGCALTAQSIENILVSLDTNGATGITLSIHGGTNAPRASWSNTANTAYGNLIGKGWSISYN